MATCTYACAWQTSQRSSAVSEQSVSSTFVSMPASIDIDQELVLSTAIELDIENKLDSDGSKQFSHYADAAKVTEAYVLGTPVEALCGKIFTPSRDPQRFPVCSICKKIAEALFLDTEN